jgi:uncharacterized protein YggE
MVATESRARTAAEARQRGAEDMSAVQNALRGAGVPADAIRTTSYSLTPEMEWNDGRGIVRGYLARNQIEVRVDNLDRLGQIIDAANSRRETGLVIHGPRYGLKDEQAAETEALKLAVQAAMARAEAMAAGARRSLGSIVRIEEQARGLMPPEPLVMRAAMSDRASEAPTPITPGEIEVRAQVTVTVELR